MPIEGLQRRVAALLKPNRSRRSFVGGSSVFNATFPRRSEDMDIYAHLPVAEVSARDAVDVLLIDMLQAPVALFAIAAPAKLGAASPTRILDRVLEIANGPPMADCEALDLDQAAMPFPIGDVKLAPADRLHAARMVIVESCSKASPGLLYVDPRTGEVALPTSDACTP